jgi:hypothetical protein
MKKTEITSAKQAIALAFEGAGGLQKFINWCRTHPEQFYTQLYVKLLPYNIVAQVDVNINQADAARSKLQGAFERLVAAGDVRTIEHDPLPVAAPVEQSVRRRTFSDEPPPQPANDTSETWTPASATVIIDLAAAASARATRPPVMNTAAAEMTTTESFYEFYNNGGGRRMWWGPG